MAHNDIFVQRMQAKFNAMKFDHTAAYRTGYQSALQDLLKPASSQGSLRYGRQLNLNDVRDALAAMKQQDPHLIWVDP